MLFNRPENKMITPDAGESTLSQLKRQREAVIKQLDGLYAEAHDATGHKAAEVIRDIKSAEAELLSIDRSVQKIEQNTQMRETKAFQESAQAAIEARNTRNKFQEDCEMIAHSAYSRFSGDSYDPADPKPGYPKRLFKYFTTLLDALTPDTAAKQVDEILTADLQRRDWQNVVGLPMPEGYNRHFTYKV